MILHRAQGGGAGARISGSSFGRAAGAGGRRELLRPKFIGGSGQPCTRRGSAWHAMSRNAENYTGRSAAPNERQCRVVIGEASTRTASGERPYQPHRSDRASRALWTNGARDEWIRTSVAENAAALTRSNQARRSSSTGKEIRMPSRYPFAPIACLDRFVRHSLGAPPQGRRPVSPKPLSLRSTAGQSLRC